jgi:hypothetical protein
VSAGYLRKCVGKIPHKTRVEAEEHRSNLIASGRWQRKTSNVYRCTFCGDYHAGRTGTRFRGKG